MDLDKLKKAAGNTIKVISGKTDDFISDLKNNNEAEIDDDILFDDFSDDVPVLKPDKLSGTHSETVSEDEEGATQRFNLQNMLDRFRQKKDDIDSTFRSILDITDKTSEPETESEVFADDLEQTPDTAPPAPAVVDAEAVTAEISVLDSQIDMLKKSIDELSEFTNTTVTKINKTVDNINGNFNVTEQKLTDISNSLASISKLNDSIFDLKNAQMNTKNSLADLEAAFSKLKKKMTASITIISALTAIIAILEIVNLLS